MPRVGKKKFPYTSTGKSAAKKYAKKTGQPLKAPAIYKKPPRKVTTK